VYSPNTFNFFHNMTGVTFLEPRPAIFIVSLQNFSYNALHILFIIHPLVVLLGVRPELGLVK
jgi:hypothetical protein